MAGKVKGKYIQPISPTMWVEEETKHVTFIFHKTKLQELTTALIARVGRQGLPELSKMSSTSSFPYQSSEGKLLNLQYHLITHVLNRGTSMFLSRAT